MAEDFIQTCSDVSLGDTAALASKEIFFISFNSFLKIVFNFTFVVFFVPKWEIILLILLFWEVL